MPIFVLCILLKRPGLYNLIGDDRFSDPQQLFYRDTFEQYPREFWRDVRPIIPRLNQRLAGSDVETSARTSVTAVPKYSLVHSFFDLLQSKDKLHTIFTQNIDALEFAAGVSPQNVVTCHGSWETATCLSCGGKVAANDYLPVVLDGMLPLCACGRPEPLDPSARKSSRMKKATGLDESNVEYVETSGGERPGAGGRAGQPKRSKKETELAELLRRDSDDEDKFDAPSRPGLLKPDITFFEEPLDSSYFPRLESVRHGSDLLIIVGTSLAAGPVNQLPLQIDEDIPQIWISNERMTNKVPGLRVDIELIGDADTIIKELCDRAGWRKSLLNRQWHNRLGSRMQAKALAAQVQQKRTTGAVTRTVDPTSGLTEHRMTTLQKDPESESQTLIASTTLPKAENSVQEQGRPSQGAAQPPPVVRVTVASTDDAHLPTSSTEFDTQPRAVEQSTLATTQPTVIRQSSITPTASDTAPKPSSPPIPFRNTPNKRPLSIGEALTTAASTNTAAFEANRGLNAGPSKKLRADASPARPTTLTKSATTAAVPSTPAHGRASSDPELKIYALEGFEWVTYFKRGRAPAGVGGGNGPGIK